MMAARRIALQSTRCSSCSVSLFNSPFGTQFRLPVAVPQTVLNARRYRASVLPQRAFHGSAIRLNADQKAEDTNGTLVESVTSRTEVTEEESSTYSIDVVSDSSAVETIEQKKLSTSKTEIFEEPSDGVIEEEREERERERRELSPLSDEVILSPTSEAAMGKAADSVPWFLRVETPRPASHPFANRQALPEIPTDAPPALEPLLRHLSEELGINDLSLIDLRDMDPPPAIGADTIMIVGNARSERHLHISADKTCRWLRSEWKMTPYADGLLGRNEIKIRNRRLKKRGRLVSTQTGEVVGVGWICVDVGSQGLVVQLFTKNRRDEIDLEGLWRKFLNKGATIKKATSIEEIFGNKEPIEDVEVKYTPPVPVVRLGAGLSTGSGFSNTQKRSFHTTLYRSNPETPKKPKQYEIKNYKFKGIDLETAIERGQYWQILNRLPPSYKPTVNTDVAESILNAQVNHLKLVYIMRGKDSHVLSSRNGVQCVIVGDGPSDISSTEFLSTFHANLASSGPALKKSQIHLKFLIQAYRINPQAYPRSCLLAHFDRMLAEGLPVEKELYYLVLRAICDSTRLGTLPWEEHLKGLLESMSEVIEHMKAHCEYPEASIPEIQYTLLRAVSPAKLDSVHQVAKTICSQELATKNLPIDYVPSKYPKIRVGTHRIDKHFHAIDVALTQANHSYTLRELQETLLVGYAMAGAWIAFWNRWKSLWYMGVHRDVEFYCLVIGLLFMGQNQNECLNAVRWLPKEMAKEIPGVGLTVGMARGMLGLLDIAESGVNAGVVGTFKDEAGARNWLRELRERCEGVIERVGRKREAEKEKFLEVEKEKLLEVEEEKSLEAGGRIFR